MAVVTKNEASIVNRAVDMLLQQVVGQQCAFVLLIAEFGVEKSDLTYLSNADRTSGRDMLERAVINLKDSPND